MASHHAKEEVQSKQHRKYQNDKLDGEINAP
jgi:hypothetical protein